jgi:UDP-N-acetylglucosamine 2-epimerase (non-hydrolysing)
MEAGNRCFDFNVPEEVNRRIVDHISDFNLVYTEHARRNLLAEGLPSRRIYLTGSPLFEVIAAQMAAIDASHALEELGLKKGGYLLASLHREENVDRLDHLKALLATLEELAEAKDVPVVLSTHPRTRKRLEEAGIRTDGGRILFHKPFSFSAYCRLQKDALCVVSDSGTISEEAVILGFAAVTPRQAIERPEALDCGSVVLTGLKARDIGLAIETSLALFAEHGLRSKPAPYRVPNTSERVVKLVVGLTDLSALWHGYTSPGEAL